MMTFDFEPMSTGIKFNLWLFLPKVNMRVKNENDKQPTRSHFFSEKLNWIFFNSLGTKYSF